MIVKKIAILKDFLDISYVKKLSNFLSFNCGTTPVFYDIETTGLSRYSTFLYLIGALKFEGNHWFLYQWMAEAPSEEAALLSEFSCFLQDCTSTIQYNGKNFDQPYLEECYKKHNMDSPFTSMLSLDIYQELKPCKTLLKLQRMKQPDLEDFLNLDSRSYCDGGECIRLYKTYTKNPDPDLQKTLLGHNEEDLLGLIHIFSMLAYKYLFEGEFEPLSASLDGDELIMHFHLPFCLPVPISKKTESHYFSATKNTGSLMVQLKEGKAKQYHKNHKDYDFIPGEDTVIPKALSRYMDKNLRQSAKPENCYTWFPCNESFTEDKEKQRQYLNNTLPCLLKLKS